MTPLGKAIRRTLLRLEGAEGLADAQLLQRFAAQRDEAAFAELVRRHGPMVHRLCRRALRDDADVEDAFQATFVILARNANTVRQGAAVAGWLYKVAHRVARHARTQIDRRRVREQPLSEAADRASGAEPSASDLRPILDEELGRLPERYRAPLVLCYLEGRTTDEAAADLGWPRGTVAGRMSRARDLLRKRLERRGLALPAAGFAAWFAESTAGAAVPLARLLALAPAGLASGTVVREGAAILAKEALRGMLWAKLRWGGILVACLLLIGTATVKWTATGKPAASANTSAGESEDFYVRWRFDNGPPKDIRVIMGQWTHRPGKPGVMVVPEAALLLPTRLPKRPVVVSVKMPDFVRRSGTGDFSVKWMRGDLGNLANDWWWDKVAMKPGDRYSWYAVDRWTVLVANEKIICVHDYHRPYPGDGLLLYVSNQVIEEIELRGLRWQDLPPEVRNVEGAVKTLKNGPRHEDAQGRVWDERGKLLPPVRQAGTFKFFP